MEVEFVAAEKLSDRQEEALEQLGAAVYPLEVKGKLPGSSFTWASLQWLNLVWEEDELVTHAGSLVRELLQDGAPKRIGGLGAVATHPAKQGRGFACQAMHEAAKRFETDLDVSYALLFCRPHLVPFYERLQWKSFIGKVFVDQPEGKVEFTIIGVSLRCQN